MISGRRVLPSVLISASLVVGGVAVAGPAAADGVPNVVITEIAYGGLAATSGPDGEYVELTNTGTAAQDLSGWSITTSAAQSLAGLGTVQPGESVLVTDLTADQFRTEWGLKPSVKVVNDGSATLKKTGAVTVSNGATVVDKVTYDLTAPGKGGSAWVDAAHVADQQSPSGSSFVGNATTPNNGWTVSSANDAEGSWTSAHGTVGSPGASTLGTSMPTDVRTTAVAVNGAADQTATVGTAFTFSGLSASGGTGSYTWTAPALAGTGLSIDASAGVISGTPTTAGPIAVTVTATDTAAASASASFTITVGTGVDPNWRDVVINEVTSDNANNPQLADHLAPALKAALGSDTADLVELYNKGDQPVDITGWKQVDSGAASGATVFSGRVYDVAGNKITSIPAHGYGVFRSGNGLGSGGDAVKIYLPDGTLVDSVTYTAAQAGADESVPTETYHALARCPDGGGAVNTGSNDAGTSWFSVKDASFGTSNDSACDTTTDPAAALRFYNLPPPTGLPAGCAPSAPSGSDTVAVPDAKPWPTQDAVTVADDACAFVTAQDPSGNDMSGLVFSSDGSVLWAAQNKNHLWKLVKSNGKYVPATDGDWAGGKAITFTGTDPSTSQPDSEGLTVGGNGHLFVTSERDNADKNVSKDTVLEYDPSAVGTVLSPVRQWDLTSDFVPSLIAATGDDANLGFEGVTYVPDSFLVAHGFRDAQGALYEPADYPAHGGGLFFVALEKNGHVYAYSLNEDGTHQRVADIDTGVDGTSAIADVQFNADDQGIWTACDNDCGVVDSLLRIDASGHFSRAVSFDRPASLPNDNLEGFAIAPATSASTREVVWSDDGIYGTGNAWNADRTGNVPSAGWGHALYSGTLPSPLLLAQTGPGTASITGTGRIGTTLTANVGTVGTDWDAGVTLTYRWSTGVTALGTADHPLALTDPALVGKTVTLTVTGRRDGYADVTRTASIVVTAGTLTTRTPTISGTGKVGSTLTASVAAWGPAPVTLTYQWLAHGRAIGGATGRTLTLTGTLLGRTVTVRVTGTKPGYTTASVTSAGVTVRTGSLTATTPTVSGSAKVGKTLTAHAGRWSAANAGVRLAYQWFADGKAVTGATRSTLKLVKALRGKKITVRVTGSAPGYATAVRTSKATKSVR